MKDVERFWIDGTDWDKVEESDGEFVLYQNYEKLFKKYQEIIRAGNGMSNCCYNLSQNAGEVLQPIWCNSMKNAYLEWDGVLNKHRNS